MECVSKADFDRFQFAIVSIAVSLLENSPNKRFRTAIRNLLEEAKKNLALEQNAIERKLAKRVKMRIIVKKSNNKDDNNNSRRGKKMIKRRKKISALQMSRFMRHKKAEFEILPPDGKDEIPGETTDTASEGEGDDENNKDRDKFFF